MSQHLCLHLDVHTLVSSLKILIFRFFFFSWLVFQCLLGNGVLHGSHFALWFITLKHQLCLDWWKAWCLKRKKFCPKISNCVSSAHIFMDTFLYTQCWKYIQTTFNSAKLISGNGSQATYSCCSFCSLQGYYVSAEIRLKHQLEKDMTRHYRS